MKPGVQTTEFWTHVFTLVVTSVVSLVALVHPGFTAPQWVQALVPMVAMVSAAVSQAVYTHSRSQVKIKSPAAAVDANAAPVGTGK